MGFRLLGYLVWTLPLVLVAWLLSIAGWWGPFLDLLLVLFVATSMVVAVVVSIATGSWLVNEGKKRQASRKYANMTPEQWATEVALHKLVAERGGSVDDWTVIK